MAPIFQEISNSLFSKVMFGEAITIYSGKDVECAMTDRATEFSVTYEGIKFHLWFNGQVGIGEVEGIIETFYGQIEFAYHTHRRLSGLRTIGQFWQKNDSQFFGLDYSDRAHAVYMKTIWATWMDR